jgi:hypothetical protein
LCCCIAFHNVVHEPLLVHLIQSSVTGTVHLDVLRKIQDAMQTRRRRLSHSVATLYTVYRLLI